MFRRNLLRIVVPLSFFTHIHAATLVWNGGGADDNWSTAANWSGVAFTAGDIVQFGGSTRLTPVNNLAADTLVGGFTFLNDTNPNVSAFTLSGNRVTLGGDITTSAGAGPTFNATITDTIEFDLLLNAARTITVANSGDKTHNLTISGSISDGGLGHGVNIAGGARLTLAAGNTYTGTTTLGGAAVVVLGHANALPGGIGAAGGLSGLTFVGGILGLGAGDFTRGLGTGADQVQWTGAGGFAAFGADRVVNIGGSGAAVVWGAGGFVPSGSALLFGYGNGSDTQDSSHMVDFRNPLDLNGGTRTITVNDGNSGATSLIDAALSGGVFSSTGTGSLTKNGSGTLSLTAAGTYTGQTLANGGVLLLNHVNALPGGIGLTGGTSNLRISGNGVVGLGTGDLTRALGSGFDQVQWTGGGGFAAFNADRVVNLGGAGGTVTWGSGSFVPTGSSFYLGATSATHTVDFRNSIDLGTTVRTLEINNAVAVNLDAIISGTISGTGGLTKNGDGTLLLQATDSSYTGQTYLAVNVSILTKMADYGQNSSIGQGTAGVPILMSTQFRMGTLEYIGSGDSSDRSFQLGTSNAAHGQGGVITNNGTGALVFDAAVFNVAVPGVTTARSLTLSGSNTGLNTISGVIQNTDGATGVLSLTKSGTGTWALAGANTYTGTTTVSAGALHLNSTSAIGTGGLTLNTNATIDNSSGAAITLSTANVVTWGGNFTFGGTNDLSFANGTTVATGSRTITLNGTGRTLAFGQLSITSATTMTVNDAGAGNKLVLGGLVLAESNQARTQTFAGNGAIEITGAVTDGAGTGADGVSYTGSGTLNLVANNTYTGTTTLNNAAGTLILGGSNTTSLITLSAGTLHVNHSGAIGSGTLDINGGALDNSSGAAIVVATANLITLDGNFSFGGTNSLSFINGVSSTIGSRVITLNGTGRTLAFGQLSITNTVTTTVNDAGTGNKLVFGGIVLAESNQARTQTFTGTAAIDITGAIVDGTGTGADGITYSGTSTMTLSAANTYTGATTVNAAGGTMRITSSSNLSTGALTVLQGTLQLENAAQAVSSLTFGSTTTTSQTTAATLTLASGTVLTFNGNLTANDNVNGQAAFLTGGRIDLNGARTWTVDDSAAADIDLTVSSIIQNTGTAGTFTKNGLGRLVLSGANTFADVFAVGDGIVRIQHASGLGTTAGGTTVNSGDALEIAGGITVAGEALLLNGTGPSATGALRSVSGTNAWSGTIDLAGDARINADAGSHLTVSAITAGGTSRDVTFGGEGDHVTSGRIGSGGTTPVDQVFKDGAGTLTLSSTANDFTGTFNLNNGIVRLGASQVIPDVENVTINKGTLDLNGSVETIAALTFGSTTTTVAGAAAAVTDTIGGGILRLGGGIAYNAGTAGFENGQAVISTSLDLNNASRTINVADNAALDVEMVISGVISNSGATAAAIVKDGAGTLLLGGSNTYNLASTIRNGTMRLGANEVLPNGFGLTLDQRAAGTSTLDLNGRVETIGGTLTLGSNSTTVAGSVNQIIDSAGGGVLRLGGGITYNTGAATFNNATSNISASLDLNGATRTFTINDSTVAANDVVISGVISNSGGTASGISKSGTGTLVLSGANTYDGSTTVNAGVLRAANSAALGSTGTVSLANTDTVLELAQGVTLSRQLTISDTGNNKTLRAQDGATAATYSGNITISETAAGNFDVAAGADGTLTLAGVISGTGAAGVSKEGAGTVALSGVNTYTGATSVNAGALQVGVAGAGQSGSGALSVATGASLLGTGVVRSSSISLAAGSTLQAGDSSAVASHGTLVFTPASASGTVHDLQGGIVLSITSATVEDGTFGGHEVGSTGYQAWIDAVVGTGSHDLLVFNNPAAGTGYTLNFLTTTGTLQVAPSVFTARSGQVFNLLDWSGMVTTSFTGFSFNSGYLVGNGDEGADLDLPDLSGTGLFWDTSRFTMSGNIAIVPEPTRMMLGLVGLVAVTFRRHRRAGLGS